MNQNICAFVEKLKEDYFDKAVWMILADYLDENDIDGGDTIRRFDMWKVYEKSATDFVHKRKHHFDMAMLHYGDEYYFSHCDKPFIDEVCIQKGLSSSGMHDIFWSLKWNKPISEYDKKLASEYLI